MWSNGIKCKYVFMFPLKNEACKGLSFYTLNFQCEYFSLIHLYYYAFQLCLCNPSLLSRLLVQKTINDLHSCLSRALAASQWPSIQVTSVVSSLERWKSTLPSSAVHACLKSGETHAYALQLEVLILLTWLQNSRDRVEGFSSSLICVWATCYIAIIAILFLPGDQADII